MTMCTPPTKPTSCPVHTTTTAAAAKFEQDKARKEKHRSSAPWPREIWQAAPAAYLAGEAEPERRFPVIITSSTGPLPTRQKLQEIAGLPLLPAVQWTTVTSIFDDDEHDHGVRMEGGPAGTTTCGEQSTPKIDKKKQKEECKEPPKEVQYCHVNWEQLQRVKACSDGEKTVVWFQEMKRYAWSARSLRPEGKGERNAEGEKR
jgi:hypothetical protein